MRQNPVHPQIIVELVIGFAIQDVAVDLRLDHRRALGEAHGLNRGIRQRETAFGIIGHHHRQRRIDEDRDGRRRQAAENTKARAGDANHSPLPFPAQRTIDQFFFDNFPDAHLRICRAHSRLGMVKSM